MRAGTEAALKHAKAFALYFSNCSCTYIIQLILKELGIRPHLEGFHHAKYAAALLCDNPVLLLAKDVYPQAGLHRDPPASGVVVERAIRTALRKAWQNRDDAVWLIYFPDDVLEKGKCPTNHEFLMAIVDFVELWRGLCGEAENENA